MGNPLAERELEELKNFCLLALSEGDGLITHDVWYADTASMRRLCGFLGHSMQQDGPRSRCGRCGICAAGDHDYEENECRKLCRRCWHVEMKEPGEREKTWESFDAACKKHAPPGGFHDCGEISKDGAEGECTT